MCSCCYLFPFSFGTTSPDIFLELRIPQIFLDVRGEEEEEEEEEEEDDDLIRMGRQRRRRRLNQRRSTPLLHAQILSPVTAIKLSTVSAIIFQASEAGFLKLLKLPRFVVTFFPTHCMDDSS